MLIDSNVPYIMRCKIIQKALMKATKLNVLVTSEMNGMVQNRCGHFGMKLPKIVKHMRIRRESGVAKFKSDTSPNLKEKGIACLIF